MPQLGRTGWKVWVVFHENLRCVLIHPLPLKYACACTYHVNGAAWRHLPVIRSYLYYFQCRFALL